MVQPGQDRDGNDTGPLHRPTQECVAAHLAGVTKKTLCRWSKVALGFETDRSPLTPCRTCVHY
jgi:hypothetical protein